MAYPAEPFKEAETRLTSVLANLGFQTLSTTPEPKQTKRTVVVETVPTALFSSPVFHRGEAQKRWGALSPLHSARRLSAASRGLFRLSAKHLDEYEARECNIFG